MTMTATAGPVGVPPRAGLRDRVMAVARMHFTDTLTIVLIPTAVLASIFAVNLVIWFFVPQDGRNTGGGASAYCFVLAAAVLAVSRGLPFAMGMGSSRRAFLLGTLLTGLAWSAIWTVLLFVLQRIEHASHGWGRGGHFFWFSWFSRSTWLASPVFLLTSLIASFVLGAFIATAWARWNRAAMLVGLPVLVLIGGGAVILVTAQEWWPSVGHWFAGQTPWTAAGWCTLLAVLLAAAIHPVLRRVRG